MQPRLSDSFGNNNLGGKQVVSDASPQKGFSPQNREVAEKKLLDWKGVQTRYTFSLKEDEVKEWMEQIIRTQIPSDSPRGFTDQLDDGTILCSLVNELLEGGIQYLPKRSERRVDLFLEKCEEIGVAKEQLFEPDDLILHRNTVKVVYCLHSLAEICHQRRLAPFFQGTQKDRTKQRQQWKEKAQKSLKTGQSFEGWKATKLITKIKEDLPPASKTTLSVAALPVIDDVIDNVVVTPSLEATTSKNQNFSTPSTIYNLNNNIRTDILPNTTKVSKADAAAGVGLYYSPTASPKVSSAPASPKVPTPSQSPMRSSPVHVNFSSVSDPMDISNFIPDPHGSMLSTEVAEQPAPEEIPPGPSLFSSFFDSVKTSFSSFWTTKSTSNDQPEVPYEQPLSGTVTPTISDTQAIPSTANSSVQSSYQSSPLRLPQTPPPSPFVTSSSTQTFSFSTKSVPLSSSSIFPSLQPEPTPVALSSSLPTVSWTAPSEEVPTVEEPTSNNTQEVPSTSFFSNWNPFSWFSAKKEEQPEELPPPQMQTISEEPLAQIRPSIQLNGITLNSTPVRPEPVRTYEQPARVVEPVKNIYQPQITSIGEQPTIRPVSFFEQPRIIQQPAPVVEEASYDSPQEGLEGSKSSMDTAILKLLTVWMVGVAVWGYSWTSTEAKYGIAF